MAQALQTPVSLRIRPVTSDRTQGKSPECSLIALTSFSQSPSIFTSGRPWEDSDSSLMHSLVPITSDKAMTNLDSVWKRRNIILLTKTHIVKALTFPVVMYGCKSWSIKKAEHRGTDALKLWCWGSLLRIPWTARRSNQPILKEIYPEYLLVGLMQRTGHRIWRADSLEKTLMLEKIEGWRRRGNRGWNG